MDEIKSLLDAVRYFSDLDACFRYMLGIKFPDGNVVCPHCNGEAIGLIASRRMLQCKSPKCRKQFSAKVGTIFEDSPLGLDKWFVAVWCIANDKNGISSCELARALGTTQKTAWFMLHRIRAAMATKTFRKLHLFRYLAEQTYRYNGRKLTDAMRFRRVMLAVAGKRLTYRELTAQDFCGFMGIK